MAGNIQSPQNGTISAIPVFVNFIAEGLWFPSNAINQSFFYVLDGQNMSYGTKFTEIQYPLEGIPTSIDGQWYDYSGQVNLNNLNDGPHNITVYYGIYDGDILCYNASSSATSQFYVGTETPSSPLFTPIPSPSPTPTPSIPEFPTTILAMTLLMTATILGTIVLKKKQSKRS